MSGRLVHNDDPSRATTDQGADGLVRQGKYMERRHAEGWAKPACLLYIHLSRPDKRICTLGERDCKICQATKNWPVGDGLLATLCCMKRFPGQLLACSRLGLQEPSRAWCRACSSRGGAGAGM